MSIIKHMYHWILKFDTGWVLRSTKESPIVVPAKIKNEHNTSILLVQKHFIFLKQLIESWLGFQVVVNCFHL